MEDDLQSRVGVDYVETARDIVRDIVTGWAKTLTGLRHCDIRLEVQQGKEASVENGSVKQAGDDYSFAIGAHVLAGNGALAPGYAGNMLGTADTSRLGPAIKEMLTTAHTRAVHSAGLKERARQRFPTLGSSLADLTWAPVPIHHRTIAAQYETDPLGVSLQHLIDIGSEASKAIAGLGNRVVYNVVWVATSMIRELFVSSDGIDIDSEYAQTEALVFVVAAGQEGTLEFYDSLGHQRGFEVLEHGVNSGPIQLPNLYDFSVTLGKDTLETAAAPAMKDTETDVTVILDPHFSALVAHEIVGHPSELDRALKYETGYAGRSWFYTSPGCDQRGEQVASELVSAFSDPTIEGYGHYLYDHEGTPAKRVYHIRDGVYEEFVNNRQTAALFGVQPNGSCRATDASFVPLVRMTNTTFAPGTTDPSDIIGDVEQGFYVSGHRIPSISESRDNFRISALKVYDIKNGELGRLYRNGAVMSDSKNFFMQIDAMGTDWRLYPVPNCGKGQPMQTKRMSNGGPSIRSVARITGGSS